jgi:hypothetical protein
LIKHKRAALQGKEGQPFLLLSSASEKALLSFLLDAIDFTM